MPSASDDGIAQAPRQGTRAGTRAGTRTRARIIEATTRLIRAHGIAAVTTKKIAAEAGCAEGSIFRHFENKGALLAVVLSVGLPESHALANAMGELAGDLRAELITVVQALLDLYQASCPLAAAAFADSELFNRFSAAHRKAGTGPQQPWQLLRDQLERCRAAGVVSKTADLDAEALSLVGACQHAVWIKIIVGDEQLPDAGRNLAERLVDARLPTLRPPANPAPR